MATTLWLITFAAYGSRLHGDDRLTVDRAHNQFGTPYLKPDGTRMAQDADRMLSGTVVLSVEQQAFVEHTIPELCARGGWRFVQCSAAGNHVHVLCSIPSETHGKIAPSILKRWLTQALDTRWNMPKRRDGTSWWSEGGSARAVKDQESLARAEAYINAQRCTP
jgi:REP element-mobilizing transposase RayT